MGTPPWEKGTRKCTAGSASRESCYHLGTDADRYYERGRRNPKTRAAQQLRELEGRERLDRSRIERRLHLTSLAGGPRPGLCGCGSSASLTQASCNHSLWAPCCRM